VVGRDVVHSVTRCEPLCAASILCDSSAWMSLSAFAPALAADAIPGLRQDLQPSRGDGFPAVLAHTVSAFIETPEGRINVIECSPHGLPSHRGELGIRRAGDDVFDGRKLSLLFRTQHLQTLARITNANKDLPVTLFG
jgi:hypothetical protein